MGVREPDLPFKVGQQVESRSFQVGFRGAWFKSEINSIDRRRNGHLGYKLIYPDFPGEKNTWIKIYQKPPTYNQKRKSNSQEVLMVRPRFPPVYRKGQMPDANTISEAVVVVLANNTWKVGDLIDWWEDGCYWSGSITKILKDDKVEIALLPPPLGEGSLYEASQEDLRPSLNWSLRHGWTVPTPKDSAHGCCAQIIKLAEKGNNRSSVARTTGDKRGGVRDIAGASKSSFTSHVSASSSLPCGEKLEGGEGRALGFEARKEMQTPEPIAFPDMENASSGKTSSSDAESDSYIEVKSTEADDVATSVGKERLSDGEENKRARGVVGAPESPFTSHTSSGSLSKSHNGCEDVVKQPLGAAAGTKRLTPEINEDLSMENGDTEKISGSDSDSSSHGEAGSSGIGNKTGAAKDTLDDGEERDVQVMATSLEPPSHVSPSPKQPLDNLRTVEKQPLGTLAKKETQPPQMATDSGVENASIGKTGCSGSDPRENGETGVEKETVDHGGPSKKMRVDGKTPQNSMLSDTIEASVVDLEELLYLIKWMKGILDNGTTTWPPWKFLGHRASSTPR